jgi:class 3 adenylate cyclase
VRDDSDVDRPTSATATFLFTDIEGSTQLLKSHRAEYTQILADHHRLLREQFAACGGREIDNQGDSFFVAFTRARDAVLAAVGCQRALLEHSWPGGGSVRVRMGIHTGEADVAADRYVGLSVHRAARICAIAHGGQILVSPTTAALLEDEEDELPGIALRDLGEHRLKDISRPVRLYQLDVEGLPATFPPLATSDPPTPHRRRLGALIITAVLLPAGVTGAVIFLTSRHKAPPTVLPNSVVRLDPTTLEPTQVIPVGDAPDFVVAAGGYVWVTNHILRDTNSSALRNAGDRTLTRVDPSTGNAQVVGGGLAPCGLTADPSGDVWVANCFAGSSQTDNVVRVDAKTLAFNATCSVPGGDGFVRGLTYGGGSLWISDVGGGVIPPKQNTVFEVDPQTCTRQPIRFADPTGQLAWADGYGDLWIDNFDAGNLTRLHVATGSAQTVNALATNPSSPVVDGDTVWVGDWANPQVVRLHAVGSSNPREILLPVKNQGAGVWRVAAGAGAVWATTPRDGAIWRIDPTTNVVARITMPYVPVCVTADADNVWVTVRANLN